MGIREYNTRPHKLKSTLTRALMKDLCQQQRHLTVAMPLCARPPEWETVLHCLQCHDKQSVQTQQEKSGSFSWSFCNISKYIQIFNIYPNVHICHICKGKSRPFGLYPARIFPIWFDRNHDLLRTLIMGWTCENPSCVGPADSCLSHVLTEKTKRITFLMWRQLESQESSEFQKYTMTPEQRRGQTMTVGSKYPSKAGFKHVDVRIHTISWGAPVNQ